MYIGRNMRSPLSVGIRETGPAFLTSIVFSFFINLLMFVSPLYMLQIYNRVLTSRNITTLIGLTVIAGLLLLVYAILEMLRSRILVRAGMLFDDKIAVPVFNAVHYTNLRQPAGGHVQALRDVDTLREFLTGSGLISFCDMPWFPIYVFAAFLLHPWFGYLAIVGGFIILSLTLLNELITRRQLDDASRAGSRALQNAQATFRNSEVLQAMGMLGALRSIWASHHRTQLGSQARASDRAGALIASTKFFRLFLQTLILGVGAYLAIQREASPGAMIAASILIGRALQPIELTVANWKGFVAARSAFGRIKALFTAVGAQPEWMALPRPEGGVTVEGLLATVPGQRDVILRNITFAVKPGQTLAVVGPSAAGKSSLARVLVGVWAAAAGTVRLDTSLLAHWDPQQLGQYIGYLPQDVELFSGTIAQNIARFGELDSEAVIAAAELAGCHEMVQHLPDGYNTQIGDGGQVLSGGQRQRIGLARALYGRPSLVVLDEPNASLDSAGEEALLAAIQKLKTNGTTAVIITHKLNILTAADQILVLNSGAVQAFGTRDEILSRLMGPKVVSATPGPASVGSAPPRELLATTGA
jgi:ATP-binding cassette subfamily C protein